MTKTIHRLRNFDKEKKQVNLYYLERQRLQGDRIKVFNEIRDINEDNLDDVITLKTNVRSNSKISSDAVKKNR